MNNLRIRQDGKTVQVIRNGVLLLDMPWDAAVDVAMAILQQARLVEEIEKREEIIRDQAILNRVGLQIGLLNNSYLQQEAMKEAQYNSELRRYLPDSNLKVVGKPTLRLVK